MCLWIPCISRSVILLALERFKDEIDVALRVAAALLARNQVFVNMYTTSVLRAGLFFLLDCSKNDRVV